MSKKKNNDENNHICIDSLEEIREKLKYAIEDRSWVDVEDAAGLLNELLGYDDTDEDEEDKKNHLEE